jgi:hypothetical protein
MTDGKDFNRKSESLDTPHSSTRRRLLTALAAGTGAAVLLPEKWVKPVVDKVMTPAHAQATVACTAAAGCYNAVNPTGNPVSFTWPGGQGPAIIDIFPGEDCPVGPSPEVTLTIVVASSQAEASSLLGDNAFLLPTTPALPSGCNFYDGGEVGDSDRRLKENVERVGYDPRTKLALYEFNYIGQPDQRYRGVMADEVEPLFPEAVVTRPNGMKAVKYGVLGIPFEKVGPLH